LPNSHIYNNIYSNIVQGLAKAQKDNIPTKLLYLKNIVGQNGWIGKLTKMQKNLEKVETGNTFFSA